MLVEIFCCKIFTPVKYSPLKDIWTYIQSVKNILPEKKDKYLRLCDVRKLLEAVMTMPGNLELDGNNCESV